MPIQEPARESPGHSRNRGPGRGVRPGGLGRRTRCCPRRESGHLTGAIWLLWRQHHRGGVEGFAWYRHEQTVDTEGVGIEFEERARDMGAAVKEPQSDSHAIDGEAFKWVADTLVEEAGITPMLHRLFVAPIMEGDVIKGVIVESKAGRRQFWLSASSTPRAMPMWRTARVRSH